MPGSGQLINHDIDFTKCIIDLEENLFRFQHK